MRKILLCMAALALVIGLGVNSANALIIVSGDSNIADPLTGFGCCIPVDTGNQQFFINILQGGTSVLVLDTSYAQFANAPDAEVNTFYNSLSGVTSTLISGPVTAAQLAGVNLFVAPMPDAAFTASEITDLSNFLSGGGSIFLLGEYDPLGSTSNSNINSDLTALGSGMNIVNGASDCGDFRTAVGSQIAVDPLTAGVATLSYTCFSQVAGGTNLFFGTQGQPFVAYEGAAPVPEPSTILLLGSGLVGVGLWRRFKARG